MNNKSHYYHTSFILSLVLIFYLMSCTTVSKELVVGVTERQYIAQHEEDIGGVPGHFRVLTTRNIFSDTQKAILPNSTIELGLTNFLNIESNYNYFGEIVNYISQAIKKNGYADLYYAFNNYFRSRIIFHGKTRHLEFITFDQKGRTINSIDLSDADITLLK